MTSFRVAWAFLTRLPGGSHPNDDAAMARSVPWFPIVGLVLGAVLGAAYLGLVEVVSAPLAGLLVVGLGAVLTGAFHEDGLADTADAFGGYTPERRLEIMRDSRIGTFGTLALVVATGLKVVSLASLDGPDGLAALVAAHALGRTGALVAMLAGPEARADGLAASAADLPRRPVAAVVALAGVVAVGIGPVTAIAAGASLVVAALVTVAARRRFGGTTGDVLGATEQLGEIVVLVLASELLASTGWLWT